MTKKKIALFLNKFYQLKRKQQIALVVWGLHALILLSLLIHHLSIRSFKPSRPIAIRTIVQKPMGSSPEKKIQTTKTNPTTTAASKPSTPKKVIPKTTPPSNKSKATAPSKPFSTTKNISVKPQETSLKELTAALSALESLQTPAQDKNFSLDIPTAIAEETTQKFSASQKEYNAYLISYLQECLDLPEYGAVKMELVMTAEGKLLDMSILSSENVKNSEFLKNRLPRLAFPCFNDFNIHEKTLTFTITFRNAKTAH
jgi:hypothetical protein